MPNMPRLTAAAMCVCLLSTGAGAQTDRDILKEAMFSEDASEAWRSMIAKAYVDNLRGYLAQRGAKVLSPSAFGAALPDQFIDAGLADARAQSEQTCLADMSPERMKVAAKAVQAQRQKTQPDPVPLSELPERIVAAVDGLKAEMPPLGVMVGLMLCTLKAMQAHAAALRKRGPGLPPVDPQILGALLSRSDLVAYPNRIVRDSVLSEVRAQSRGGRAPHKPRPRLPQVN